MNTFPKAHSVHSEGDVSDYTRFSSEVKLYSSPATLELTQRIQALKELQEQTNSLKQEFSNRINELIRSFGDQLSELNDARRLIISGENNRELEESIQNDKTITTVARGIVDRHVKRDKSGKLHLPLNGLPDFWLTVFKNSWTLREIVQAHDEPILSKLEDLKVKYTSKPKGFYLEFHFGKNDYFDNYVLTKQYIVDDNPTSLKTDFKIIRSSGCQISWFPDKNVTVKLGEKRQKHKISGNFRYVTTTMKSLSFFNFFDPPVPNDGKEGMNRVIIAQLAIDYDLGQYFRTKIVPDAYLYFTGQMDSQDDEDFEDDDFSETSSDSDTIASKRR